MKCLSIGTLGFVHFTPSPFCNLGYPVASWQVNRRRQFVGRNIVLKITLKFRRFDYVARRKLLGTVSENPTPTVEGTFYRREVLNRAVPPEKDANAKIEERASRQGNNFIDKSRNVTGKLEIPFAVMAVVVTSVLNRVLHRMALVPLENYVFFLAQLQTFGYVTVYATVLMIQKSNHLLHPRAFELPQDFAFNFLTIGFVEALASLLSFVAASQLPGVMIPLLSQTTLLWQVCLVYFFMRQKMSALQLFGVVTVMSGVILAAWPTSNPGLWIQINPAFVLLYVFSCLFPAINLFLKEKLFLEGREKIGADVDLFIINTFGSAAQAFFVLLLFPFIAISRGIPLQHLGNHLAMGWECFKGMNPACGSDCTGAPLLPVTYVLVNLIFNIAALNLIRKAGNIAMSLVMSGIIPLSMWAFSLNLPFLGQPVSLTTNFLLGSLVLTLGLLVYNGPLWIPAAKRTADKLFHVRDTSSML